MSITIDIPKELEDNLRAKARVAGMDIHQFIERLLRKEAHIEESHQVQLPKDEAELLKKINLGLSKEEWERYYGLIEKREAETLTQSEHEELIQLSDKIEEANANRIRFLADLALLRGISLSALMEELGIQGRTHAEENNG